MFVGRVDTQVKLHGMRIELGEIEAVLTQHPGVKQAAVVLHEPSSGMKHLAAYVVPVQAVPPSAEELRRFLNKQLPHVMVPAAFVVLDAFPLTPTGKVNRKAFHLPSNLQPKQENTFRASQTNAEQILIVIWQQVLGVEPVGLDDNFFELGGDSIMSLQIVARAAEAGLHLTLQQLFQSPTVAGLAALVDTAMPIQEQPTRKATDGVIPLTPIQHWFFKQNFPNPHQWNQSLLFITAKPLDPIHLRSAVAALLSQHDALRLRYTPGPLCWQQVYADPVDEVPFEVIDLSDMTEVQQTEAIETHVNDQQSRLDLSAAPLIRVVNFVLGANRPGRLLIVIHHLVVDGVSWRILLEDLQVAYHQFVRGQPIQLPLKTTTFQEWASRLADYAQSPELKNEASFWLDTAVPNRSQPATDLITPDQPLDQFNTEGSTERISVSLSWEETQALLRDVQGAYGTEIGDILLTALARAFQRWTGNTALWIDLESHGREHIFDDVDLSRTVGWFTSLYPVGLDLPPAAEPGHAIQIVKEQLRHIPYHGLGFGLLRYLCPDPSVAGKFKEIPPAPVSFNYLGQLSQAIEGVLVSPFALERPGHQRSPEALRPHLIDIDAAIFQSELRVDWSYSSQVHFHHSIGQVAGFFIDELRALIAHCLSPEAFGYTPSDFPGVGLSQRELDTILRITSRSKGSLPKRNLEAIYPLSPLQQGMVFHTLYTPETGVYFEQTTFTVQGPFDVSAFKKAWQRVLDRHTILRTSFVLQGLDRVLQLVHKIVRAPLDLQDWRDIPTAEQHLRFEGLLATERRLGFDLTIPPLLRLTILQTAADTYQVLLNHHHALLDGWSIPLLFEEVFAFYDAFTHDQDLPSPPPRPYHDYITWLQTRDLAAAETFWRKELDGFVPEPSLPGHTLSVPFTGASQPAEQEERLSPEVTGSLQVFVRQQRLTLSTLVQGAWAILLSRRSRREDVLFGITVAGRPSDFPGAVTMIGLFINTIPLRVQVDPQSQLHEWLQHLQDKAIEIQRYDYSPLAQIQAWSRVPRKLPLFETILVVENYPTRSALDGQVGSLRIGNVRTVEQTTYPLTFAVIPGQQLGLKILYDPARFEPAVIHGILNEMSQILESMVTDPNQRLSTISLEAPSGQVQVMENQAEKAKQHPAKLVVTPKDEHSLPGNPLENYLVQIWKKLLKIDRLGIHDSFFELGGDSLSGAICIHQLQDALSEIIPITTIFEAPTIYELARVLEQKHPEGVARLLGTPTPVTQATGEKVRPVALVPIHPQGSKPPLFCIHPAGGVVFPYYTLAPYLGKDQPLYGIQDPSLFDAHALPSSIEAMASHYLEVIKTVQPEGPYRLLGWSAGGVVAYEMAQQLSRQGQSVAHLVLLDTNAPVSPRRLASCARQSSNHTRGIGSAVKPIARYIQSGIFLLTASKMRNGQPPTEKPAAQDWLGWAGFDSWRTHLLKEAEVARTISQDASLLLVEMPEVRRILELVKEHRRLVRRYVAERYEGRITLFRAVGSEQSERQTGDPTKGWGILAMEGVEVYTIQANHVALLVKPYVEILAQELMACLDRSYSS